jgi:hypothetical protein
MEVTVLVVRSPAPSGPLARLVLALVVLAGLGGCSSSTHVVPLSDSEKQLTSVAMAYQDAHGKLGRGPKDAEELKPFLKEFGDPDQLLISPADKEPYVVIWGADPSRGSPTDYQGMWQILAYEAKGQGGKRAVTDVRGRPMTVPESDFSKLKFVGRHVPSLN